MTINKILICLDGSIGSDYAFDRALEIAKLHNAEIIIANVIDLNKYQELTRTDAIKAKQLLDGSYNLVEDFKADAYAAGFRNVLSVVEFGSLKTVLGDILPKKYDVDLIVLGATGMSYLKSIYLGSTVMSVLQLAPCDVMVVRNKD